MDTGAEKWHFGDFHEGSWNRCQTIGPYEIAMLKTFEWIPFVRFRDMEGQKWPKNSTKSPSNACNSILGGWIQQAFCTKTFYSLLRIFWHQFHLSTWKSPFRDSVVPLPHPYQEATCAKPYNSLVYLTDPRWNLARFYGMLRPRCLPNFFEIDWENERVIRVQSAQTAILGTPKKRFNRYISRVIKHYKGCVLAVNSAHYTRDSGKNYSPVQ